MLCGDLNGKETQKSGNTCGHTADLFLLLAEKHIIKQLYRNEIKNNNKKENESSVPIAALPANSPTGLARPPSTEGV